MIKPPDNSVVIDGHVVNYARRVGNTAAVKLYAEAWAYLLDNGLCTEDVFPNTRFEVVWIDGVGLMTCEVVPEENQLWVGVTYVREVFRSSGACVAMWKRVKQRAMAENLGCIAFRTAAGNTTMNALGRRLGKAICTEYEVPVV